MLIEVSSTQTTGDADAMPLPRLLPFIQGMILEVQESASASGQAAASQQLQAGVLHRVKNPTARDDANKRHD